MCGIFLIAFLSLCAFSPLTGSGDHDPKEKVTHVKNNLKRAIHTNRCTNDNAET
jgi:hypothetical protein